jgi:hypothetical protein
LYLAEGILLKNKIVLKVPNSQGEIDTYIFSSSLPDDYWPLEKKVVRATNVFCILKMSKQSNGTTKYQSFAQADPNFYFNLLPLFKKLWGSKIKEWYESLTGYMDLQIKKGKMKN